MDLGQVIHKVGSIALEVIDAELSYLADLADKGRDRDSVVSQPGRRDEDRRAERAPESVAR